MKGVRRMRYRHACSLGCYLSARARVVLVAARHAADGAERSLADRLSGTSIRGRTKSIHEFPGGAGGQDPTGLTFVNGVMFGTTISGRRRVRML